MGERHLLVLFLTCMLIRVQAQQSEGINLTSSGEPCFGQTFTLTCTHPDPFQDTAKYLGVNIGFFEQTNNEELEFYASDTAQKFNYSRLSSTVSTLSFNLTEEDYANVVLNCSCFLTLTGGGKEESNPITINIEETIQPPTLVSTPNSAPGLLQWRPSSNCSSYRYNFTLTWVRIGDGSTGTVSTAENRYNFTGMPRGEYTVSLRARVTTFNLNESEPLIVNFTAPQTEQSTEDQDGGTGIYIGVPVGTILVVIIVLIVIVIVIITAILYRNRKKKVPQSSHTDLLKGGSSKPNELLPNSSLPLKNLEKPKAENIGVDQESKDDPPAVDSPARTSPIQSLTRSSPERPSSQTSSEPASPPLHVTPNREIPTWEPDDPEAPQELGQTMQELDKKQEAENQIQYAAIDFSGQRPMAPPSLETVVYTETVEQFRNARKNRPIPPLPPAKTEEEEEEEKQLAQEAAEITADFKAQVVAILQASKLVYRSLDPEEPVVGTYQKKTFVANFVHAPGGKEILSSEVEAIIKDRQLQSTDKGFLVATTDSISGPWLEYLEKHNCHFIGLSCKGGVKKEMLLKKLSFCFPESSSF